MMRARGLVATVTLASSCVRAPAASGTGRAVQSDLPTAVAPLANSDGWGATSLPMRVAAAERRAEVARTARAFVEALTHRDEAALETLFDVVVAWEAGGESASRTALIQFLRETMGVLASGAFARTGDDTPTVRSYDELMRESNRGRTTGARPGDWQARVEMTLSAPAQGVRGIRFGATLLVRWIQDRPRIVAAQFDRNWQR